MWMCPTSTCDDSWLQGGVEPRGESMNPDDIDTDDIDTVVANMSPEERAEFLAWCDERRAEALAFQMEHEEEEPEEG